MLPWALVGGGGGLACGRGVGGGGGVRLRTRVQGSSLSGSPLRSAWHRSAFAFSTKVDGHLVEVVEVLMLFGTVRLVAVWWLRMCRGPRCGREKRGEGRVGVRQLRDRTEDNNATVRKRRVGWKKVGNENTHDQHTSKKEA
ncbi:hypothetical protein EJ06DRAFT_311616 [Trichodelitschia bisporula]|uniref:Uncharacterized protein n=1 Tax=Trichodelitschia bisporula TaxID=703511 RepID=A0A6G1I488_9PEZI|nr:hypothetical protein EJ06DRAFT_311616 [Trichodelitschia bisporula]